MTDQIATEEIEYHADVSLRGFWAWDAGAPGPKPAVLLLHEWWGHNDYVRQRAQQLAKLGLAAFAIDMYGHGRQTSDADEAASLMNAAMSDPDQALARFKAAYKTVVGDARTTSGAPSAVGYCFGGAVALHMTRAGVALRHAVALHPGTLASGPRATPGSIVCDKVLVCVGADDPMAPADARDDFVAEMTAANVGHELVVYPDVVHSFTVKEATARGQATGLPLAYDAHADQDSWQRLAALLTGRGKA